MLLCLLKMLGRSSQSDQNVAIARVQEMTERADLLRAHMHEIVASRSFRGSRRSCDFLEFVVEKALSGEFDLLKERTLGVRLFHRDPAYDTSEDAIVRVTASDVRKRLLHYYSALKSPPHVRIELPPGSYIARFHETVPAPVIEPALTTVVKMIPSGRRSSRRWRIACLAAILLLAGVGLSFYHATRSTNAASVIPWSAILRKDRPLKIIFSDPNIATLQQAFGYRLSLADYASRRYLPTTQSFPPEATGILGILRGTNVPAVDAATVVRIGGIVPAARIQTLLARTIHPADFKRDDNFVILGSPLSNPWVGLFQNQLDFEFVYDAGQKEEVIRNRHPAPGEAAVYAPTIPGWGTGQAYAIAAFVANPNQSGRVMILSGSNAAATEAAGKFITDPDLVARTLKAHGLDPQDEQLQFELLFHVTTVASSLNTFDIVACHRLSTAAAR